MQRIFARNLRNQSLKSSQSPLLASSQRQFAASPQPNPFDKSVLSSLSHNGSSHKYYNLPAL